MKEVGKRLVSPAGEHWHFTGSTAEAIGSTQSSVNR